MNVALSIRNLQKSFGETCVIQGLSLDILKGERHVIIGPNGAGKSTLFHLISGLLKPTAGEVVLGDRQIAGMRPHAINRLGLSRSFQISTVFKQMSVFENLRISVMASHDRRFAIFSLASRANRINEETERLMKLVRLDAVRDRPAGDLTYSEQRALEIGMSLGPGCDVLLLDEPTAGMSNDESMYMVELVREVAEGKSLVVIEHDMDVVFSLADRISVLEYGSILATGTPAEIQQDERVQQAYLGGVNVDA